MINEEFKPWDIKSLRLSLGGEDDGIGWIDIRIVDDEYFCMTIERVSHGAENNLELTLNNIDMDVARRLRDFLNYAISRL